MNFCSICSYEFKKDEDDTFPRTIGHFCPICNTFKAKACKNCTNKMKEFKSGMKSDSNAGYSKEAQKLWKIFDEDILRHDRAEHIAMDIV